MIKHDLKLLLWYLLWMLSPLWSVLFFVSFTLAVILEMMGFELAGYVTIPATAIADWHGSLLDK